MMTDTSVAADQLAAYIDRIERLEAEKKTIMADMAEVYKEAGGDGFDVKAMKELIRIRKMEEADRNQREELLDIYKRALGMEP